VIAILAEPADLGALWLRSQLLRRLAPPVEIVTPARLVYSRSILHRLTSTESEARFELADGMTLRTPGLRGIVNRLTSLPTAHLAGAAAVERDYAAAELHAFLLGWLASLDCPLLNPPAPENLAGPSHSNLSTLHFAALSGLSCQPAIVAVGTPQPPPPAPVGTAVRHFVLDGQVIGPPLPSATRDSMILFARLWGARLVQIETTRDRGRHEFIAASSVVDLQAGGEALVRAISRVLSS
jgi:hypothetical protein